MFGFPDIDFSIFDCSDQLEAVGLESTSDLVKPAIVSFLKDGIQKHISACNLSKEACDELIQAFNNEGFEIVLDETICPDVATLPTSFSDTSEDAKDDAEHQRALNYAFWAIEHFEISSDNCSADDVLDEAEKAYPLNLLKVIFGVGEEYRLHSPELYTLIQDECDLVLGTLPPIEEKLSRAICHGVPKDDIIRILGGQNNAVVTWAITEAIERIGGRAFRKLRHPYRSKRLKDFLLYNSYLENVPGATLDDIKNSFLRDRCLSWTAELDSKMTIDWSVHKESLCFQKLLDVSQFPANLIYQSYDLGWSPWPTGLLMGTALTSVLPNHTISTVQKAYFSTSSDLGHYLLVVGQLSDSNDFYELFEFIEGDLHRVVVDVPILKNLCLINDKNPSKPSETEHLRTLYHAEARYCRHRFRQASDSREKEYYQMFLELTEERLSNLPPEKESLLDLLIEELDLSLRAVHCLARANINTVRDLISKTEDELMRVRNLGRKSCEEVINKLKELGLELDA